MSLVDIALYIIIALVVVVGVVGFVIVAFRDEKSKDER